MINNGHIEFENSVSSELKHMKITFHINLVAKIILIMIILVKWYTKRVRHTQTQEQKLNEIVLQVLRKGEN